MTPEQMADKLRNAISQLALIPIAEDAGLFAVAIIDQRTRRGEFLGGRFQNKGYSTAPMPFSNLTRQISTSEDEVFWITRNGQAQKYLKGGYKMFREKTGRRTDKVELTFSGAMLNSLFPAVDPTTDGFSITITVPSSQMEKAFHTNNDRTWLDLSDSEMEKITNQISSELLSGF